MSASVEAQRGIGERIAAADKRYGPFASTHEALGVCSEEWRELQDAIRSNAISSIQSEALDLAAALIRLHDGLNDSAAMRDRSVK